MAIEKLSEFAKDGQKNTDDLNLTDGFPVSKKPARQWFNWLFNSLTSKVNEIIDAEFIPKAEIVDNLTTNDATKPVSAKQAKKLQDEKFDKSALNNTLTSTSTTEALTAAQGKVLNDDKANKTTTLTAGNGLSGGGTLEINRTLTLGTPSKITGSTTNSVTATSHTHEIDNASTSVAGVVKLNNTLTSTSTTEALTAAQGKVLNDKMFGVGQSWQNVTSSRLNNTTYQNTTSRLIFISITLRDGGGNIELLIDDQRAIYLADIGDLEYQFTAVVGAGASYRLNTTNPLKHWSEYR